MLVQWNPWNELSRLEHEVQAALNGRSGWFAVPAKSEGSHAAVDWEPAVDIEEDADKIRLRADLPGLDQKDVEVSLENHVLTLRGERKGEKRQEGEAYHHYERVYGTFARSFRLPSTIETEKVTAEMRNGVLTLILPKRPEAQARQIKIHVAS